MSIVREITRSEDGAIRKSVFVITLDSKIMAYKGSPESTGQFWTTSGYPPDEGIPANQRLAAIRTKQGALFNLFSAEGGLLEVQPWDGSAAIKANVVVRNINIDKGFWYEYFPYTITLEANSIYFGSILIPAVSVLENETWSMEQADDKGRTYRLTHKASASSKNIYNIDGSIDQYGWEKARDIVIPHFGLNTAFKAAPDSNADLSTWSAYNYVRGYEVDEAAGKYTATESWLVYDSSQTGGVACLEEYTITSRLQEDGKTKVTIDGTLTGLEVRDNTTWALVSTRYSNAAARYAALGPSLFSIATAYAGINLNSIPLGSAAGTNPQTGVITFNREYDNRRVVFPGAISATIQISNKHPTNVFASLVVPGKIQGPVLQDIATITSKQKNVAIEIVMPAATVDQVPTVPSTDSIVVGYNPGGFLTQDEENWNEDTGRYSRQTSWTYI